MIVEQSLCTYVLKQALFAWTAVCLYNVQTTNKPSFVHLGIPQDFLETGNSCEYLGIVGIPEEIQDAAILNKVFELPSDFYSNPQKLLQIGSP